MSLGAPQSPSDLYGQIVTVQPLPDEVKEAITFITHALATSKLLGEDEEVKFDEAITVSRRAIGYINSYDSDTKKEINDMQEFLATLFQTSKYKDKPKSRIALAAEKVFLEESDEKPKIPKSAPITIQRQKMHEPSLHCGSSTPDGGFYMVACSPPARTNPPIYSQMGASPIESQSVFAIFMQPAFSWGSPIKPTEIRTLVEQQ